MSAGTALRARLAAGEQLVGPGVYDALSAKLCAEAGFPMMFLSGYAVAAVRLGAPDVGLLTLPEVCDATRSIVHATDTPVVVDGDTGYGNPLNVIRTVREVEAAGAAGLLLEDQVWPKRCGHMAGKAVIPADEHVQKLRAALDARRDPDFLILARTDAREPLGLDAAIERACRYRQAGADVTFIEAPRSEDELRRIAAATPAPRMANMLEQGRTPRLANGALLELGFQVVAYPLTGLFSAAHALRRAYGGLARAGDSAALEGDMIAFDAFNAVMGLPAALEAQRAYGPPDPGPEAKGLSQGDGSAG